METNETSNKKPIYKKWWAWVFALTIIGIVIRISASPEQKAQWAKEEKTKSDSVQNMKAHRISLAKFNAIQNGMTREQVESTIAPIDTLPEGDETLSVEDIRKLKENPEAAFDVIYRDPGGIAYGKITYRGKSTQRVIAKIEMGLE
jgi:hypothetical protein